MIATQTVFLRLFVVVMAGDLIIPYLLAPLYPGYRHRHMVMSVLGNPASPVRRVYNCWLFFGGIGFGVGAWYFACRYIPVSRGLSMAVLALLLAFAVGAMILSGLFSVGETKEMTTVGAKIHGYGSSLGFLALLFAPLLLSILSAMAGDALSAVVCALSFGLALAAFVLFVMADKPLAKGTFLDREGTWQRLILLFLYLPMAYLVVK